MYAKNGETTDDEKKRQAMRDSDDDGTLPVN